jgi:hypothetical protein
VAQNRGFPFFDQLLGVFFCIKIGSIKNRVQGGGKKKITFLTSASGVKKVIFLFVPAITVVASQNLVLSA